MEKDWVQTLDGVLNHAILSKSDNNVNETWPTGNY